MGVFRRQPRTFQSPRILFLQPLLGRSAGEKKAPWQRATGLLSSDNHVLVRQHGQQQKRHDIRDLNHRVNGGTGRILIRITNRIAGNRGMVGV